MSSTELFIFLQKGGRLHINAIQTIYSNVKNLILQKGFLCQEDVNANGLLKNFQQFLPQNEAYVHVCLVIESCCYPSFRDGRFHILMKAGAIDSVADALLVMISYLKEKIGLGGIRPSSFLVFQYSVYETVAKLLKDKDITTSFPPKAQVQVQPQVQTQLQVQPHLDQNPNPIQLLQRSAGSAGIQSKFVPPLVTPVRSHDLSLDKFSPIITSDNVSESSLKNISPAVVVDNRGLNFKAAVNSRVAPPPTATTAIGNKSQKLLTVDTSFDLLKYNNSGIVGTPRTLKYANYRGQIDAKELSSVFRKNGMDFILPRDLYDKVLGCIYLIASTREQSNTQEQGNPARTHKALVDIVISVQDAGLLSIYTIPISKTKLRGVLGLLKGAGILIVQHEDELRHSADEIPVEVKLFLHKSITSFEMFKLMHDKFVPKCVEFFLASLKENHIYDVIWRPTELKAKMMVAAANLDKFRSVVMRGLDALNQQAMIEARAIKPMSMQKQKVVQKEESKYLDEGDDQEWGDLSRSIDNSESASGGLGLDPSIQTFPSFSLPPGILSHDPYMFPHRDHRDQALSTSPFTTAEDEHSPALSDVTYFSEGQDYHNPFAMKSSSNTMNNGPPAEENQWIYGKSQQRIAGAGTVVNEDEDSDVDNILELSMSLLGK